MSENKDKETFEQAIKSADNYDPSQYLQGESLEAMYQKIAREPDLTMRECMLSLLESAIKAKREGHWNCDHTSTIESIFGIRSILLDQVVRSFCKSRIPQAQIVSSGHNVRMRFHPEGSLGMSINSWKEIALVRFSHPSSKNNGSDLCNDWELGYEGARRFSTFQEVCDEIANIENQLVERRKTIAESKRLAHTLKLMKASSEFSAAIIYMLNDEGIHLELAPGVSAKVTLSTPARRLWYQEEESKEYKTCADQPFSCGVYGHPSFSTQKELYLHKESCLTNGGLSVQTVNTYSFDYFGGSSNLSATAAVRFLRDFAAANKRRVDAFSNVFLPIFSDELEGPTWSSTILRVPTRESIVHQHVRLIKICDFTHDLLLWATTVVQEDGQDAIVMCPKLYNDDSGCAPTEHNQVLTVIVTNTDGLKERLVLAMDKLWNNYCNMRRVFGTMLADRIQSGTWVQYSRNKENKQDKTKVIPKHIDGRIEFYLCSPYHEDVMSFFSEHDWGMSIGRSYTKIVKVQTIEAFDAQLDELVAANKAKEEARAKEVAERGF